MSGEYSSMIVQSFRIEFKSNDEGEDSLKNEPFFKDRY